jgi:hypothetical protein
LPRGCSGLRKQNERNRSETKQNADYDAEFEKCGLGRGFLFHWMEFGVSNAFVETPNDALTGTLISLQWNALST